MEVYMDDISNIKFNLTPLMAEEIVKINNLKIELQDILKEVECNGDNNELSLRKKKILEKIDIQKKKFIKEFQKNNQEQINEYLRLKKKN